MTHTIERLAREGKKHLLVIPISFVTEHIETLHEINIEAREEALALGVEQFEMMPALGDSPRFIDALAVWSVSSLAAAYSACNRTCAGMPTEYATVQSATGSSACGRHFERRARRSAQIALTGVSAQLIKDMFGSRNLIYFHSSDSR